VFNGDSRDAVQRVIENLPLYPYIQVDLTPLRSLQAGR
jgi:muconolactone delta-isomerase